MPAKLFLDEDIIAEILTRLPAEEVVRLRCVCKRWLSLTSDPRFIKHHSAHNPHPSISGFFLPDHINGGKYFQLYGNPPGLPDPTLSFIPTAVGGDQMSVESSCNGLIICYRITKKYLHKPTYYVCNPTTREFVELPAHNELVYCNFTLVFDPSKSPHYKVVNVWSQIHIYSSQTRSWKFSVGKKSLEELGGCYPMGTEIVYWNNALILVGQMCLLSFDLEEECMKKLPMPAEAPQYSKVVCIGKSREKLQMIARSENIVFYILEMDLHCFEWSVLCKVDLERVICLYPETRERPIWTSGLSCNMRWARMDLLGFAPICFFRGGEDGGDGILLLNVPGKIISYDLKQKVFKEVCDLSSPRDYDLYDWRHFYFFGHTLFSP